MVAALDIYIYIYLGMVAALDVYDLRLSKSWNYLDIRDMFSASEIFASPCRNVGHSGLSIFVFQNSSKRSVSLDSNILFLLLLLLI